MTSLLLAASLLAPAFACDGEASDADGAHEHCTMPSVVGDVPADGTHTTLAVTGMTCGGCADTVHTALLNVKGVKGARVDSTTGKAEVAYDSKLVTTKQLLDAIAATQKYTATLAS